MYGQGNHAPQFGQGPPGPTPPYMQPPFGRSPLQGPPGPLPPVIQQAGSAQGGPLRALMYPNAPPVPQGMAPRCPPGSASNFLQSSSTVHGSAPMPPPFPLAPQSTQYTSHLGIQNVHNLSLPPLAPPFRPRVPLLSPSQDQMPYQPQLSVGTQQGLQHAAIPSLPPPPPRTDAVFSPYFNSSAQPVTSQPQLPPEAPPQPPPLPTSSPPPLPTSSPPPPPPPPPPPSSSSPAAESATLSSTPVKDATDLSIQAGFDQLRDSTIVNIIAADHNRYDTPKCDDAPNLEGGTRLAFQSSEDGSLLSQGVILDGSSPPPKPTDEKIIRNIEILCQFISKNGPAFEEMARQKELGNPEFKFLFGGEPGSEAANAHEYYLWMKKKCGFIADLQRDQGNSNVVPKQVEFESSVEQHPLTDIGVSHSPADSDVDMEDDITQIDKEPGVHDSLGGVKPDTTSMEDEFEFQKQENTPYSSRDCGSAPNTCVPSNSGADADIKTDMSAGELHKMDSPFRLIQNYASDDTSEDDGNPLSAEVEPPSTLDKGGTARLQGDMVSPVDSQLHPFDVKETPVRTLPLGKSSVLVDINAKTEVSSHETISRAFEASNVHPQEKSSLDGATIGLEGNEACKEDTKSNSTPKKVDKFGRLIREGVSESESDSDDSTYTRHARRGRSRSRSRSPRSRSHSRSPQARKRRSPRRSPWRRRERRSRSRSWSPKRRRSRSRSPYRSGGDYAGDKQKQCFDFLKGKCYRGASCRYRHHESDKYDGPRRHLYKQQHSAAVSRSRNTDLRERNKDKHAASVSASRTSSGNYEAESLKDIVQPRLVDQDGAPLARDVERFLRFGEADAHPPSSHEVASEPTSHLQDSKDRKPEVPSDEEQLIHQSQPSVAASHPGKTDGEPTGHPLASGSTSMGFQYQNFHLPLPPPPPALPANAPHVLHLQPDFNSIAPTVVLPPQSAPSEITSLYQAPISNRSSHYPLPQNPSWTALPPTQQRPPYVADPRRPGVPMQFQDNLLKQNDITTPSSLRSHLSELPGHSHLGGLQPGTFPLIQDSSRPPQAVEDFRSSLFPAGNVTSQSFGGPNGDERYAQFPKESLLPSVSFASVSMPPQPVPSQVLGDSSSQNHTYLQQQPPSFALQQSAPGSISGHLGGPLSGDRSSRFTDLEGSRLSSNYNPYASTFDQPLSSRFSMGLAPLEALTARAHGGGKTLPRPGGDQYDPLFDSIDPSSESFKNPAYKQDHAADNSDIILRLSGHKVPDVEETNKQKEVGGAGAATSVENDGFGEMAEAEVGAVENGSPSNRADSAEVAEGDVEIDQVKTKGKSKKTKDSRSMKLFKIALASFVKDYLKPQWRQGNLSKEVFKTIVKKTVDKVSGAMRHIPKSQEKIDRYINSSEGKIRTLVEGYLKKYRG